MKTANKKAGTRPAAFLKSFDRTGCPGGAKAPPGLEGYFFFAFLAFFAFFAFFAFLAIASSFGLMEGNATRGMLGEGYSLATASIAIPTDSRGAASHCHLSVITLSTVVMRFRRLFGGAMRFPRKSSWRANARSAHFRFKARVNDASMDGRVLRRSRTNARWQRQLVFTNSKPRRGLIRRGESPLSGAVASSTPRNGEHQRRCSTARGDGIVRALDWQC